MYRSASCYGCLCWTRDELTAIHRVNRMRLDTLYQDYSSEINLDLYWDLIYQVNLQLRLRREIDIEICSPTPSVAVSTLRLVSLNYRHYPLEYREDF